MSLTLLQAVVRVADARTPDTDLLARFARDRDEAAFEELVRRHGPLVWAVCRQLLAHQADAEDAFQAVFLALVRGASGIRAGQALAAWLHGVAVRVAVKAKRDAARRRQREERAAVPEADRPVPDAAWAALMTAVHEEVQRLPAAERTAFVLCDLEGVRQPDAAARLGWPLGTLSGRLCKARQRLVEQLTRRGVAPGVLAVGGLAASSGSVPAALVESVTSLPTAPAAGIPSTVAELARGLAEGVTMRTKLTAAAFVVVGALGLTGGAMILSTADAQTGGGSASSAPPSGGFGQPPGTGPGAPPGGGTGVPFGKPPESPFGRPGSGAPPSHGEGGVTTGGPGSGMGMGWTVGRPAWEYKFVDMFDSRDTFEQEIVKAGADGWEYAGSEQLVKYPAREGGAGAPPRPKPPAQLVLVFKRPKGGATGGGMMGMGAPGGMMGGGAGGSAMVGGGMAGANQFRVFRLQHVAAEDVVLGLRKAMPAAKLRAVAEKTSNSVIVIDADAATMKEVARLIEQLDAKPGARPPTGGGSSLGPPPGTGGAGPMPPMGGSSLGPPGGSGGLAPPMGGVPLRPEAVTNVMALKHADAAELAAVLKKVFPQSGEFTADPRTNQLIIRADQETLQEVAALVERLDIDAPKKR